MAVLFRETVVWQGVYLDDLLVTCICDHPGNKPTSRNFKPPPPHDSDPDMIAVAKARAAYTVAGLARAEQKAFVGRARWTALRSRQELWKVIARLLTVGLVTKETCNVFWDMFAIAFSTDGSFSLCCIGVSSSPKAWESKLGNLCLATYS